MIRFVVPLLSILLPLAVTVGAHPAWGIAVDDRGQVYFSDLEHVWKLDAQGKLSLIRAAADHVHELNVDAAGNVFGAENSYDPATQRFFSAIWKITAAGAFSYLLAPIEDPPKGTSIWKDAQGNMYHFDNYPKGKLLVLKRTPNGDVSALIGDKSAVRTYHQGVPYSAGSTALGADGSLYFTNGSSINKVTPRGTLTLLARDLRVENSQKKPASRTPLFGIAVDQQNNVFVADHGNRRVIKIAPNGALSAPVRAEESWYPTGVAVRGDELYILEEGHTLRDSIGTRVRKLSADGSVAVLTTVAANGVSSAPANPQSPASQTIETPAEDWEISAHSLVGVGLGILFFLIVAIIWRTRARPQILRRTPR